MKENIKQAAEKIKILLEEDAAAGMAEAIGFARLFASEKQQLHQALMLKLKYTRSNSLSEKDIFADKMFDLILDIEEDQRLMESQKVADERIARLMGDDYHLASRKALVCEGRGISKAFRKGGFSLNQVDIELRVGEITGVVGENGNGKTTLFRILGGALEKDRGVLHYPFLQDHLEEASFSWAELKQHIAFIPQELERWYGTVRDNLHYTLALHNVRGQQNEDEVDYILYRLGLETHQYKSWSQLSGGYKLRFALARALVWKPKLLIIDEPLANLDVKAQLVILNDLRDLANGLRFPLSIIISSQHLHEIESVSDRLIFLKEGNVIYNGALGDLGKERKENTFEFTTDLNLKELERKLSDFEYLGLQDNGLAFVIRTPLHIDGPVLLSKFINEGMEVHYFRNISQSTKKLFV